MNASPAAAFKPGDLLTLTGTGGAPPQVGMVVEFNEGGGTLLRIIVGDEVIDVVVVQPASAPPSGSNSNGDERQPIPPRHVAESTST